MIPGLASDMESRLLRLATPAATSVTADSFAACDFQIATGRDAESHALGVQLLDGPDLTLVVTDPGRPVGDVRVRTAGEGNLLFLDNRAWTGALNATIRILGNDSAIIFNDIGPGGFVGLTDVFLRSARQLLFWGVGSTAVACGVELEGDDESLIVGDDALISSGVWVRNHGMHALHDLRSGARIGRAPVTCVIERHVWLGQEALLLGCERIGQGAVIGARSLVNRPIPPCVVAAGAPARVLREAVSWGRDNRGMTGQERVALGWPERPEG